MTNPARTVLIALIVVGTVVLAWAISRDANSAQVTLSAYQPPQDEPAAALLNRPMGMSGCLAAACHGGPADKTLARQLDGLTWASSGSCWAAADPHTTAYSVLEGKLAKDIMAKYANGAPATEDARCLACHTNPTLAGSKLLNDPHARQLRSEGVSCEACHGNAGGWLSDHTTWKGNRGEVYAKTGMTKLYDLGERAKTCAGCHVGAPGDPSRGIPVRDMNHDMIAAGHPRLDFDFAEYMRRLPPHWQEKDRTTNTPRTLNSAKVWYVGRVVHAEAACQLLEDRAKRSLAGDTRTPWPEFAEFNCAACHHTLRVPDEDEKYANWRRSKEYLAGRPLGSTPWQTIWPLTHAPGLPLPKRTESPLSKVIITMEVSRAATAVDAKKAATESLGPLREKLQTVLAMPDKVAEREARGLFPAGAPLVPEWDTARQLFFGYAALDRTRRMYSDDLLDHYKLGVNAFRDRNWPGVEKAFKAIRKK